MHIAKTALRKYEYVGHNVWVYSTFTHLYTQTSFLRKLFYFFHLICVRCVYFVCLFQVSLRMIVMLRQIGHVLVSSKLFNTHFQLSFKIR
jgi:hypothetical protein